MALSYVTTSGDGATTNFAVPFQYLDKTHVHVYISSIETVAFTWVNDATIQITPAPASGTNNVEIRRVTPRDAVLVDFNNGSVLYDTDLDVATLQTLFISQEYFEQTENFFPAGHSLDSHTDSTPAESTAKGAMRIYDNAGKTRAIIATDGGILQGDTADSKGAKFLAVGTNGQTLEVDTGVTGKLAWKAPLRDTLTTKGDIFIATGASTVVRKAVGSEGQILISLPSASDGQAWQDGIMNGAPLIGGHLVVTSAANAATFAIKTFAGNDPSAATPVYAVFRDSNGLSGSSILRKITASCLITASAGSSLGVIGGNHSRIHVYLLDNGGTVELAIRHGHDLGSGYAGISEGMFTTSSTEGGAGAADNPHVMYSATGRTNVSTRYVGYAEFDVTVAGNWPSPFYVHTATYKTPIPGTIIQSRFILSTAHQAGTTTVPFDDTIPQITEGNEYMSLSIAPVHQCNILQVTVQGNWATNSASTKFIASLFRDAVASALATVWTVQNALQPIPVQIHYQGKANSTAVTSFQVRCGSDNGGATVYFNGDASRKFGGVMNSWMRIDELWI